MTDSQPATQPRRRSILRYATRRAGKKHVYSVAIANVFSGSVVTQLRWGEKLCMHLEAKSFRIFHVKNYEHRFRLL